MLASISPLGERARNNRWWVTLILFASACAGGGAALGGLAGGLGSLTIGHRSGGAVRGVAILGCLVAAAMDTAGWVLPPHRQVDEGWLTAYRRWVYASGFGVQLGAGVMTVITTAAVPLMFLLAFLSGEVMDGLLLGAAFGVARAAPVAGLAQTRTPAALRRRHQRLAGAAPVARWATVGALVLAAAAL
jgi:hypothetical protein